MANADLTHIFTITTGDRWDDGHGKYDTQAFKCSHSHDDVRKLYGMSCKLHSIDLTRYCSDYEDSSFPEDFINRLYEIFGAYPEVIGFLDNAFRQDDGSIDGEYVDQDLYVDLYFWIAKLVDGTLAWKKTEALPDIDIGGYGFYWN